MDVNSKYIIENKEIGSGHYGVVRKCTSRGEQERTDIHGQTQIDIFFLENKRGWVTCHVTKRTNALSNAGCLFHDILLL